MSGYFYHFTPSCRHCCGYRHIVLTIMLDHVTFHVLSLPHTITSKEYLACAYTQKVLNLCKMLTNLNLHFYHYGNEGATVDNHVTTIPAELYQHEYGKRDWRTNFFQFDQQDIVYKTYYTNTAAAIKQRQGQINFVLCPWGWGNQPVIAQLPAQFIPIESGIGYDTTFSKFRVFESYAWMHHVYGLNKEGDISYYDAVIPNYYDLADFDYKADKQDYFLFLGRLIPRKGLRIFCDIARQFPDKQFVCAGQGHLTEFNPPPNVLHVGYVDLEKRRNLLANAKALIAPTVYHEPFGGVTIEAMLSGTPIITTDVGGFTENNIQGFTGYRFRQLNEACKAVENVCAGYISGADCRRFAVNNFSLERVQTQYLAYFDQLSHIFDGTKGWYGEDACDLLRYAKFGLRT